MWSHRSFIGIGWILLLVLVSAGDAFAHKVIVFAWVDGNIVNTESKFHGGRMVQNAHVDVYGLNDKLLVEGETDSEGRFSFPVPQKTDLKIVVKAGMGHQGEWTVRASELSFAEVADASDTASVVHTVVVTTPKETTIPPTTVSHDCLTEADVDRIVNAALDKKMKPVVEKLSRLLDPEKSPGIPDILGGIGYILGLVGVGAYVRYRKTEK